MNVLLYSHAFAPSVGGVETYVMLLACGLTVSADGEGDRTRVTVATPTPARGFEDASLPFHVVRQPRPRTLWRLLGDADVVQLAGPALLPMAFALLRRKPIVVEHHGYQASCPNGLLLYEPTKSSCPGHFMHRRYHRCLRCNAVTVGWPRSLLRLLLTFPRRELAKRVAVNVSVTHHVRNRLRLPRSKVIYHGIPDATIHRDSHGAVPPSAVHPACFAYVGRLVSEKGLCLLVEAAKRLKTRGYAFRLTVVGDGPERRRLETLTNDLGLGDEIHFAGVLQGKALDAAVADVAALVMPSLLEETAGLAAIEQMMRGRVVIAADIGGLTEVVGDAGLKFPVGDADGLTRCLQQVLDAPERAVELGERARHRAAALFRQERMVAEHLEVYRRLLSRGVL